MHSRKIFLSFIWSFSVMTWLCSGIVSGGMVAKPIARPATYPSLPVRLLVAARLWKQEPTKPQVSDLMWSPDGKWAAYVLNEQREIVEDAYDERSFLCLIRADGRDAHRIYRGKVDREVIPATWSPDSKRLLFWENHAHSSSSNADGSPLFDVSVTGGKARLLTVPFRDNGGNMDAEMMRDNNPNSFRTLLFSPDGNYLLLVRGLGRFETESKRLVRITYPAGTQKWLSASNVAVNSPAWSPDSRRIAYLVCPDTTEQKDTEDIMRRHAQQHLRVIDSDGQHPHVLTADPHYSDCNPQWQSDNATIVFNRFENTSDGKGKGSRWEIRADGTGLRRIGSLPD